jgi:prepilin-type N-terminal cleavage/methylation domain-containing protein
VVQNNPRRIKKAFTLIELVVSLMIVTTMTVMMYGFFKDAKSLLDRNRELEHRSLERQKILSILHDDVSMAESVRVEGGQKYSLLFLTTPNSLHENTKPYIAWVVLKEQKKLVRFESNDEIRFPVLESDAYRVWMDDIVSGVEIFKCFVSPKGVLITLKDERSPVQVVEFGFFGKN